MKHLSLPLLAETVSRHRKAMKLSQSAVAEKTNINRSILSRLEAGDYNPSVDQLLSLSGVLGFSMADVIVENEAEKKKTGRMKITVAPGKMKVDTEKCLLSFLCCRIGERKGRNDEQERRTASEME